MTLHIPGVPRTKRHILLLIILVATCLSVVFYLTKYEVTRSSPNSRSLSNSQTLIHHVHDHRHQVVHAIDHGCYLQTGNMTHYQLSPRLLAERNCSQKLPVALIVGGALCGTTTFKSALSLHPDVVVPESDLHFFDVKEGKDKNQYRRLMPYSLSNQITIDESQEYMYSSNISEHTLDLLGKGVKIIILIRDPVARAVSEYLVLKSEGHGSYYERIIALNTALRAKNDVDGKQNKRSKRHVKSQNRKKNDRKRGKQKTKPKQKNEHHRSKRTPNYRKSLLPKGDPNNMYTAKETRYNLNRTFEETVLDNAGGLNMANFLIQRSIYTNEIRKWKKSIPRNHRLILDAEAFARTPANTMSLVEQFLGLEPFYHPQFFDFDLPNGVMCFNSLMRACVQPPTVRGPPPVLAESLVSALREFFESWMKVQNRFTGAYFPHLGEHPLVFTPFR